MTLGEPKASSTDFALTSHLAVKEGRRMPRRQGVISARDIHKKFLAKVIRTQLNQLNALRLVSDLADRILELQRRREDASYLPSMRTGDPHLEIFEAQLIHVKESLKELAAVRGRIVKRLYEDKENFA